MKLNFLDIHQLVKSPIIINELPMTGRVTLLGDAAHPMYSIGSNVASQSILVARGLILSFDRYDATPQGLQAYDDLRRSALSRMILATRHYGSEEMLKVVAERTPNDFKNLSNVLPNEELKTMLTNFKQVIGFNVQILNKESPLFF
ncbi:unnamed protein product [Adineta ricciae]|uniref:FAD-binding domain-containing protein n=1 Tax=Adineta ricciae TaxID=249248 RepID=A0A814VTD1_ADIRI|nr:unnamed protein product [Adineta ricciae]CAF1191593.1 unnamed protein product [Adineta ricciae]